MVHRLALVLVWLTIAMGAVVFAEPAPVDLFMMCLIVGLPLVGLAPFKPAHLLYFVLWLIIVVGGYGAATQSATLGIPVTHTTVTLFLVTGMLVLSAFISHRPFRHALVIMNAQVIAASIAALAGLIGYFSLLPGAFDLFTKFGRAAGPFKDPNVFGPFVGFAALYALNLIVQARPRKMLLPLAMFGVLALGLLLSFSRGAWLSFAVSLVVYAYLAFVMERRKVGRLKLVAMAMVSVMALAIIGTVALQFDKISSLMQERASLSQSYDVGPNGRFAGQDKARGLIVEHPLGLGAAEFQTNYHHEDVHNVYLSMFLNSGWIGGWAYLIAVLVPLFIGLRHAFVRVPTMPLFHVVYGAYIGTLVEGLIIDTDHWRHFYLLIALVMGLALSGKYKQTTHSANSAG